jgi:hypothetical protein
MLVNLDSNTQTVEPVYADFFKRYSRVMGTWLQTLRIPDKTISIHYGSGERIWSKVVRNRQNYSIDLPICSYFLKSYRKEEHNHPPEISRFASKYVLNSKPLFYKLNYEVVIWVKFLKELDVLNHQIDTSFTPQMFLEVTNKNWQSINGQKYWIDCILVSKNDAVENEPGDKTDRVVKIEMEVEVSARLPFIDKLQIANPIESVQTNFYLGNNLEEKTKEIKDNIQDDNYLNSISDYNSKFTII